MSENVYDICQIGFQGGTTTAPGAQAAAKFLFPVDAPISPDLNLGSQYPNLDRGRNIDAMGGSGYHGVRLSNGTITADVRAEDIMAMLELIYGGVVPTGSGPYSWVYKYETGAATVIPATIETGNIDLAAAQEAMVSALLDQITLGFAEIQPEQASPWKLSGNLTALDRVVSALTGSLSPVAASMETFQGHLTRFYEGTVGTAFASLTEDVGTLKMFSLAPKRNLAARPYGSASDIASAIGFSAKSTVDFEMLLKVSTTTKTNIHDVWNTSGASLGERRIRVKATGTSPRTLTIDARAGLFAAPWGDSNGERVYHITGKFADDATLDASHTVTVVNGIAALPS